MAELKRKGFSFYASWGDALADYEREGDEVNELILMRAIYKYALWGEEIDFEGAELAKRDFRHIRPILDTQREKAKTARENGKKSNGAPKGNQNARKNKTTNEQPKTTNERKIGRNTGNCGIY